MNKILKTYLPGLSIAFTFIVLYTCCMKLLSGEAKETSFAMTMIEFAGYLLIAAVVDFLTDLINFKTYLSRFSAETLLLYPVTGAFAYFGNWFSLNAGNIIFNTFIYIAVMAGIHYYFYLLNKKEAEKINQFLLGKGSGEENG